MLEASIAVSLPSCAPGIKVHPQPKTQCTKLFYVLYLLFSLRLVSLVKKLNKELGSGGALGK